MLHQKLNLVTQHNLRVTLKIPETKVCTKHRGRLNYLLLWKVNWLMNECWVWNKAHQLNFERVRIFYYYFIFSFFFFNLSNSKLNNCKTLKLNKQANWWTLSQPTSKSIFCDCELLLQRIPYHIVGFLEPLLIKYLANNLKLRWKTNSQF